MNREKTLRFFILTMVVSFAIVHAEWLAGNITIGGNPRAIAVNPVTNKLYIACTAINKIRVMDCSSFSLTYDSITVDSGSCAIGVNPLTNKIYSVNQFGNTVTIIDGATKSTTTVHVGLRPRAIAVNGVTGKIYTANSGDNSVTVINGSTGDTVSIPVGTTPVAIAVNAASDKIYTADSGSSTVTVIDGSNNHKKTLNVGDGPCALAVNTVTGRIFVANSTGNTISVIDGETDEVTKTVTVGDAPVAIAVNQLTNKIYVANGGAGSVSVVDGEGGAATTITAGAGCCAIAVNQNTNRIYAVNTSDGSVTVIDGSDNSSTVVNNITAPFTLTVNPFTGKVYVLAGTLLVIDGSAEKVTNVDVDEKPTALAINPVTNKIYVANHDGNTVTVIDGVSNSKTTIPAGTGPSSVAVNPVTNKIYVTNAIGGNMTVIDGNTDETTTIPLDTNPIVVGVNVATNKIYVPLSFPDYKAKTEVIDGASNMTTYATAGCGTGRIVINPVENKIVISTEDGHDYINGATNGFASGFGETSGPIAVNPATNTWYTSCDYFKISVSGGIGTLNVVADDIAVNPVTGVAYSVSQADGLKSILASLYISNIQSINTPGKYPEMVEVNPITNKIYVANTYLQDRGSNDIAVIDGATRKSIDKAIPSGNYPVQVAINQVSNKIYIANINDNTVTIIDESPHLSPRLSAKFDQLPNNSTYLARPTLTGKAVFRGPSGHTGIAAVLQCKGTASSAWKTAQITSRVTSDSVSWTWNWGTDSLLPGENFLCIAVLDSQCVTAGPDCATSFAGDVFVYPVYRLQQLPAAPEKPVLISPAANSVNQPLAATFLWHKSPGAASYTCQISKDPSFSSIFYDDIAVTDTSSHCTLDSLTQYYWRVQAFNIGGISEWSDVGTFTTVMAVPPTPQLIVPIDGAVSQPLSLTLYWRKARRAENYYVEVASDSLFKNIAVFDTLGDSLKTVAGLDVDTKYFWRVAASNIGGCSQWSPMRRFTTYTPAPPVPSMVSPANDATEQPVSPTLVWNKTLYGPRYHVQVSLDNAFSSIFKEDSMITDTVKELSGFAKGTRYFWRLRAINGTGSSDWTSAWSFVITGMLEPKQPTLVSPGDGVVDQPVSLWMNWNKCATATTYYIQVALDSNFNNIFTEDSLLTDTAKYVFGMYNDTVNYWRVRAKNAGGVSAWSLTRRVKTIIAPPTAVYLLSPAEAQSVTSEPVSFLWRKNPTATGYHIQIATDTGFTDIVNEDSSLVDTAKSVSGLSSSTTYYWRVLAKNFGGSGPWARSSFKTGTLAAKNNRFSMNSVRLVDNSQKIAYFLPHECFVSVNLYDLNGRRILSLVNQNQNPGTHYLSLGKTFIAKKTFILVFRAGNFYGRKLVVGIN